MLTSIHTLFMREHNLLAEEIKAEGHLKTDEELYQV